VITETLAPLSPRQQMRCLEWWATPRTPGLLAVDRDPIDYRHREARAEIRDQPMDFADASVVLLATRTGVREILTASGATSPSTDSADARDSSTCLPKAEAPDPDARALGATRVLDRTGRTNAAQGPGGTLRAAPDEQIRIRSCRRRCPQPGRAEVRILVCIDEPQNHFGDDAPPVAQLDPSGELAFFQDPEPQGRFVLPGGSSVKPSTAL